jgi:hypothetical protein
VNINYSSIPRKVRIATDEDFIHRLIWEFTDDDPEKTGSVSTTIEIIELEPDEWMLVVDDPNTIKWDIGYPEAILEQFKVECNAGSTKPDRVDEHGYRDSVNIPTVEELF